MNPIKKGAFLFISIMILICSCSKSTDNVISEFAKEKLFAEQSGEDLSSEKYIKYSSELCKSLGVENINFPRNNSRVINQRIQYYL